MAKDWGNEPPRDPLTEVCDILSDILTHAEYIEGSIRDLHSAAEDRQAAILAKLKEIKDAIRALFILVIVVAAYFLVLALRL